MTAQSEVVPPKKRFTKRDIIIAVVLVSIGIHLAGGLVAGIWIVARYLTRPPAEFVVHKQIELPPDPRKQRVEMKPVDALRPKPSLNNKLQSLNPSPITLPDTPKIQLDQMVPIDPNSFLTNAAEAFAGPSGTGAGGPGGFFGSATPVNSALVGYFYDLKQDRNGRPSVIGNAAFGPANAQYLSTVTEFLRRGWATSTLTPFYRSSKPLYSNAFMIPRIDADEGPRAFGMKDVEPRFWLAHYRGRVVPTVTGRFRFVGFADDILVVRFNNRIVLNGSLVTSENITRDGRPADTPRYRLNDRAYLVSGDWINIEAGTSYEIEVLVGERPGGHFSCVLAIEQEKKFYRKNRSGFPTLPLFQTGQVPRSTPTVFPDQRPFDVSINTLIFPGMATGNAVTP